MYKIYKHLYTHTYIYIDMRCPTIIGWAWWIYTQRERIDRYRCVCVVCIHIRIEREILNTER